MFFTVRFKRFPHLHQKSNVSVACATFYLIFVFSSYCMTSEALIDAVWTTFMVFLMCLFALLQDVQCGHHKL